MNFLTDPTQVDQNAGTTIPDTSIPAWMLAADNHNIGNNYGGSWLDPSSWGDKFSNAGKFIATSVLSGANSFYNTGVTVGNWFGAGAAERDTNDWIAGLDSNLGAYYGENRQAADLAGFIAGSFIPGLGGIKILSAGQKALSAVVETGILGKNMARATGLLVPKAEGYVALASKELAQTNASFSLINLNVTKALGAGVWQSALEGAAFETAVQATMFRSSMLQDQDVSDIVKNIAVGAIFNAAIGGAFAAAKSFSDLKTGIRSEDIRAKYATSRTISDEAFSSSDHVILQAIDRDAAKVPVLEDGMDPKLFQKDSNNFKDKITRINNSIRTNILNMVVGKDPELANLMADTTHVNPDAVLAGTAGPTSEIVAGNFLHADQVTRIFKQTEVESEITAAAKAMDLESVRGSQIRYVKLLGENAGTVQAKQPLVTSLSDSVIPRTISGTVQSTKAAVMEAVNKYGFSTKTLWDATELTGKAANHEAEARYIWFKENAPPIKKGMVFSENDIPALEAAFEQKATTGIKWVSKDGTSQEYGSTNELYGAIKDAKERVANELLQKMVFEGTMPVEAGTDSISRIVNTSKAYLEGSRIPDREYSDLFSRQTINKAYDESKVANGLSFKSNPDASRTEFLPEYAKVTYKIPDKFQQLNGNITDAISYFASQAKIFQQAVDNVFSKGAKDLASQFPEISDEMLQLATRIGAGPGLFTFAAGKYGSLESAMEQMGSGTARLKLAFKEAAKELLNSPLVHLSQDTKGAIEVSTLWSKLSGTSEHYILAEDGAAFGYDSRPGLIARKIARRPDASEDGFESATPVLQPGAEEFIPIGNDSAYQAIKAHRDANANRINLERDRQAALGRENFKDPEVVYPVRPNTGDYNHFAFVVDPRVTGAGHVSMIHAAGENELKELAGKVPPEYKVLYKGDTEAYFDARGSYDFDRSLNENYIDSDLRKRGVSSEFFVQTDPEKIVNAILNHHMRAEDISAVELVRMKYQKQMDFLLDQAGQYSKIEGSRYSSTLENVEKYEKNPYTSYIKTGLDVSKQSEYPLLASINRSLDSAVSKVVSKVGEIWDSAKSPADLDGINEALKDAGYNGAYYDAATNLYANHTAPKGELSKFIRGANGILSKFILGLDPMNALNNTIGANVLRGTELSQVTRAIREGNPDLIGKLADLTKIALPGLNTATITSPMKLYAAAFKTFLSKDSGSLIDSYKAQGYIRDLSQQFKSVLDDIALTGTETVDQLGSKLDSAFTKAKALVTNGEKYTGNTLAEEFNRFVSANVMDQITSVGVQGGVLTQKEANAYINTFVNRVEGNTIATQRPLIFSGPVGQAIGLFQSYQFNLLQNLFRYAGEGRAKDVSTLLGLQGTFYGLNGMPGFSFINQHIVGTASGNDAHKDLYDATYGIAGKTAGEFLLYGLPSFGLQSNLYTRGDINPRQLTIIPTTLAEVPIVGAFTKFFQSIKDVADNVKNGAPVWESFLQGVEHNGISRPMAGVAQVFRGAGNGGTVYSTTSQGTIMGQNDLLSWGSAVRLAGARPMDEAIVNDAVFRIKAYEAVDRTAKLNLSEAVKISTRLGELPADDQISTFAQKYAAAGGKQSKFNNFVMHNMKNADVSQSQQIMKQLSNPLTVKLQGLMGGDTDNP